MKEMKLTDILKELHTVSGFRMSLYDASGKQVCVYPRELNPFCTMVQKNREALGQCRTFDSEAFERARETGTVYIYKCHCGLCEAVAPLYDFGILSGFLMMGQVTDTVRPGRGEAVRLASRYTGDGEMLKRAAQSIPVKSEEQIRSCALTTAFRKSSGTSIMEYLTSRRMERGMELLRRTDRKVGEVAVACGFPDQNYFCKRFKQYYGISPSRMRECNAPKGL